MIFWRQIKQAVTNPAAWLLARESAPLWAFFFRIHLLVAFALAVATIPTLSAAVGTARTQLNQLPQEIVIQKQAGGLRVSGTTSTIALLEQGAVLIDPTTTSVRATSTVIFLGAEFLEVAPPGQAVQKMPWKDFGDFTWRLDEWKTWINTRASWLVIGLAISNLLIILVGALLNSLWWILFLASAAYVVRRFLRRAPTPWVAEFKMHLVLITGPLIVWGLFSLLHVPFADTIEIILLVMYSMAAGRLLSDMRA